jgi:hypothetical protein
MGRRHIRPGPQIAAATTMDSDTSLAMYAGHHPSRRRSLRKQRTVNPLMASTRYNFLSLPQGRPCGRPPAATHRSSGNRLSLPHRGSPPIGRATRSGDSGAVWAGSNSPGRTGASQLRRQLPTRASCQPAGRPGRRESPATASCSLRRACWMLASISSERWGRPWTAGAGSAGSWTSHAPGW